MAETKADVTVWAKNPRVEISRAPEGKWATPGVWIHLQSFMGEEREFNDGDLRMHVPLDDAVDVVREMIRHAVSVLVGLPGVAENIGAMAIVDMAGAVTGSPAEAPLPAPEPVTEGVAT